MLILSKDQVSPCQLNKRKDDPSQVIPGIRYNGRLFVEDQTFPADRRQDALAYSRRTFLDEQGEKLILLIESEDNLTIWQENKTAQSINENPQAQKRTVTSGDVITRINIKDLVGKMRDVGGVKIKDRVYRLKTYASCFLGTEAVQWFMKQYGLDQTDAVQLGQRLISESWIHHVTDDHTFKDEQLFYRFYWDEH